jgi:transcriptional regulator with XRE-family HTH domain
MDGVTTLPDLLRDLRLRAALRVPEVAEALGVPRSTAYSWETPAGRPEPETLARLLKLYKASEDEELLAYRLRAVPLDKADAEKDPAPALEGA